MSPPPTPPIDASAAARLLAHMVEAWLLAEPRSITTEEITDECNVRSGTPQSAGVRLRQAVDAGPSTSQPGEYRASICTAGQSIGAGMDAANDPDIGSGPGRIGSSDGGPGGLQDAGSGCLDGPGRGGVCPRGVASRALEPRLAPSARAVRADGHVGDRCRWLLRPGGLQRWVAARAQGHDGASGAAFSARAPPRR